LLIPPPLSLLSSPILPPPLYNMSQYGQINYELLAQQQQEQLAVLQAQIQALLVVQAGGAISGVEKVARPQIFDGSSKKVSGFVTACKLYIRMKVRGVTVEEQIQWILLYV